MANFVLLYTGGSMPATQEEQVAILKEWNTWYDGLGGATVDGGNPFTPVAKHLEGDRVEDGPVGIMATGYAILKADSLDAAVQMAKGCPILKGRGQITVYETFNIM